MRVIQLDFEKVNIPDEVHDIQLLARGLKIVVSETEHGIDVTIHPSGEPYNHRVHANEVSINNIQIRIAGASGSAL